MNRYPQSYLRYLTEFHQTRDFFECHEVLEEYWKEHPDSLHKDTWVGLIQVAVALYHERRGNRSGAKKMLQSAIGILKEADVETLGLDGEALIKLLSDRFRLYQESEQSDYRDLNLPIRDPKLAPYVAPVADSRDVSAEIVHKHTRRDRSEVIAARMHELEKRKSR